MNNTNHQFHTLLSISSIFENSLFKIPNYQRGYSWEKKQREDLLDDVLNIVPDGSDGPKHYMGTIVAKIGNKTQAQDLEYQEYEIVDGQQRLTSILLLCRILINHMEESIQKNGFTELLFSRPEMEVLRSEWDRNRVLGKLLNSHSTNMSIIEDITVKNKAEQNVVDAWIQFNKWVVNSRFSPEKLIATITEKLGFIFFTPKRTETLGIMFEVINNRGKELSELDKLKNYLIYYASVKNGEDEKTTKILETRINENWGIILDNLSSANQTTTRKENNFISDVWFLFSDSNIRDRGYVYTGLKENYRVEEKTKKSSDQLEDFVQLISEASSALKELYTAESKSARTNERHTEAFLLEHLRFHRNHDALQPLFITVWVLSKNNKIEHASYEKLLELIEIVNFRLHELPVPKRRSDTFVGEIIKIARNLYRSYYPYQNPFYTDNKVLYTVNQFSSNLEQIVRVNCPIDSKFLEALTLDVGEDYDYYNWASLRYFLAAYEQSLRYERDPQERFPLSAILDTVDDDTETNNPLRTQKEHLFASKNRWVQEMLKIGGEPQLRRLANFILLKEGENKSLGNIDLEAKLIKLSVISGSDYCLSDGNKCIHFFSDNKKKKCRLNIYDNDLNWRNFLNSIKQTSYRMTGWISYEEMKGMFKKAFDHYEPKRRFATLRRNVYVRFFDLREEKLINWALHRWMLPSEKAELSNENVHIDSFKMVNNKFELRDASGDKMFDASKLVKNDSNA